jgi:glucose/mannose transport system substrate-binding protein
MLNRFRGFRFLFRLGHVLLISSLLLAGCQVIFPTPTPTPLGTRIIPVPPSRTPVEVFTPWVSGGEAAGLRAWLNQFNANHPEAEALNAAAGAGTAANAEVILRNRLYGQTPPDVMWSRAGRALLDDWVTAGYVAPLAGEAMQNLAALSPALQGTVSESNSTWAVPVSVQRVNVLWYSPALFTQHKLQPPSTWAEFLSAAAQWQSAGLIPLALADADPAVNANLFDSVLMGALGPDDYAGLATGRAAWTDARVTEALATYQAILPFVNTGESALTESAARQLFRDGRAAMFLGGDWADADFRANGFSDYAWTSAPGTAGAFVFTADALALPVNAPHPELASEFLALAASRAGQQIFNEQRGSLCARNDCDYSAFSPYVQSAADDWRKQTVIASPAYGLALPPAWTMAYYDTLSAFHAAPDVAAAQASLARAAAEAGIPLPSGSDQPAVEVVVNWPVAFLGPARDAFTRTTAYAVTLTPLLDEARLRTRFLSGQPPDVFQVRAGYALTETWVTADYLAPLDALFAEAELTRTLPAVVLNTVKHDGHYWAAPVSIDRVNVLWYNDALLKANGLAPADLDTWEGWLTAAEKLKTAGVTPLTLGGAEPGALAHLLELALAGTLGADQYAGLWTGQSDWRDPQVTLALETFQHVLNYAASDYATLTAEEAGRRVANGEAAMMLTGDGALVGSAGVAHRAAPGTDGVFILSVEAFALPPAAPHPEAAQDFLSLLAGASGQQLVSQATGALCARADCSYAGRPYLLDAAQALEQSDVRLSAVRGVGASPLWAEQVDAIANQLADGAKVDAAQTALYTACVVARACAPPPTATRTPTVTPTLTRTPTPNRTPTPAATR